MNAPEKYVPHSESDDEIDLRDIALAIYDGWKWIAASIISCAFLALAYIYVLSTPEYSTELSFSATPDGLSVLNGMPGTSYTELQALEEFSQRLSSYENFKNYHEENPENFEFMFNNGSDIDSLLRNFFFNRVYISSPGEGDALRTLSLKYTSDADGPKILNDYFNWTENFYAQTLQERATRGVSNEIDRNKAKMDAHLKSHQDDIASRIEVLQEDDKIRIAELKDRLAAEKRSIISSREERIRVLVNAEKIAYSLGINKPTTPRELGRQTQDRDVIYAEINSQGGLPLYFMGVEALRAEREVIETNLEEEAKTVEIRDLESQLQLLSNNRTIEAINNRENITPFIEEYNNLRSQNEILSASIIFAGEIDVASPKHWAYPANSPDSPRSSLIMVLSIVLGGMLGVMLIFISNFIASIKTYKKTATRLDLA